ncbi:hypothetical protein C6496_13915 [Candidatus Poribacteria bacterium]|nr:MAG: hypothetical protein C6496_13915 [Candidatus Poribacteria bacterium]
MFRDFLTNKWVLGGIGFLILLSVACVLWYQHDIADEKKAAAEAEELLRQSEIAKKVSDTDSETKTETQSSEKIIKDKLEDLPETETEYEKLNIQSDNQSQITEHSHMHDHENEVPESPFGFGIYPEIPAGFPIAVSWQFPDDMFPAGIQRQGELLSRVLIKLFNEGDHDFIAGKWHKGKVYPIYPNTFYVEVNEDKIKVEGKTLRTETIRILGPSGTRDIQKRLEKAIFAGETLSGVRVYNMHEHGIDPFHYLFKNKGE